MMSLWPFFLFWATVAISLFLAFLLYKDLGLPARGELRLGQGAVESPPTGETSVNFTLSGWRHPLHYDSKCGATQEVATAVEQAHRLGKPVRVKYRSEPIYTKPVGLAYHTFAISAPGLIERTYAECQVHWIANNRLTAFALSPFAVCALYLFWRLLRSGVAA